MINWLKKIFKYKQNKSLPLPEVGDIYWFSDTKHWQLIVTNVEDKKVYWRWIDDGLYQLHLKMNLSFLNYTAKPHKQTSTI